MPGGNSIARPNNRDERKAVDVKKEAKRVKKNIVTGDFSDVGAYNLLKKLNSGKVADALDTLNERDNKEISRYLRKKQGYANGGCVSAGRGGKYKGSF